MWHRCLRACIGTLDEIFAGDCEGLTYEEIERTHGDEARTAKRDKLGYRYPARRVVLGSNCSVGSINARARVLQGAFISCQSSGYFEGALFLFSGGESRDAPKVEIPLHTLIKITWDGWRSIREERIAMEDFTVGLQDDGQQSHSRPSSARV